jgi:excisionase family DNA binding protein
MDKESAAKFLDVSTRTLQRYTTQGKIAVTYKHGKTGAEADYDESELRRFKEQQENVTYQPAQALATSDGQSLALAPIQRENAAMAGASLAAAILERLQPAKTSVPIESKPLLKLDEASILTGLSRQILRDAIEAKKLKAKIVGRAWRIRRTDLDQFLLKNL